jgi:NAD-dependent deacetylase
MKKVLFFTGAGISAESGIPTFGEQEGLRDKLTRSFALNHKEEYRETIKQMCNTVDNAKPNNAHLAIAKYNFPVITMNIDGLHQKAGSENVISIHGRLPNRYELYDDDFNRFAGLPVLYGDKAPEYGTAIDKVNELRDGDKFIIVGVPFYAMISKQPEYITTCRESEQLKYIATCREAEVIIINDSVTIKVPKICELLHEAGYVGL